jgi:cytochrome P450
MSRAPGPGGLDMIRVLMGRRGNPVGMLRDLRERYGDVVRIPVGATPYFILSGIEGAKHVLIDNARNYSKGPAYQLLAAFLGEGLVTADGDHWKRHRRMVQPALQRDRMPLFVSVMAEEADAVAARMTTAAGRGETVDVFALMLDAALRIIARAMLGGAVVGREQDVHHALTFILTHLERVSVSGARVLELLPGGKRLRGLRRVLLDLPTRRNREFRDAIRVLDDLIYGVIAGHRAAAAAGTERGDLVTLLLSARDENGATMSDKEVRDEVMTMFLAGHETVATGLAWAFHLLSKHPRVADAIAAEGDAALGARAPNADDLAALPLAERVFEEAMRLHPPVWRISRLSLAPDTIGGFDVPAGSIAVVAPVLIHRDRALWDRPDEFDPSRFEKAASAGRSRLAFMPFGAGQRMCIGASFAMAEAQIVLTAVCRAVRLSPVLEGDPAYEPSVTLRPRGGVPVTLSARAARPS